MKSSNKTADIKTRKYGAISFRLWHGMRFTIWLKLLIEFRFSISPRCILLALSITLISLCNSVLSAICSLAFNRRLKQNSHHGPPVFIVGHWRSGTTLLHELMACNPGLSAPNYYQCFVPDHFLLTERLLKPLASLLAPEKRPMDDMDVSVDNPQEDECAILAMGLRSPYRHFGFPSKFKNRIDDHDMTVWSELERKQWFDRWLYFLKCVTLRTGKPLVLKSPSHTMRLRYLLEKFPDAKFVHITRCPLQLLSSMRAFYRALFQTQGLEESLPSKKDIDNHIFAVFKRMYTLFEKNQQRIPKDQLSEITYEELVANPRQTLVKVFSEIGLDHLEIVPQTVEKRLERSHSYRPNIHLLSRRDIERVEDEWSDFLERYHYQDRIENTLAAVNEKGPV